MKYARIEILIAATLPLAGCMPMEQASLTYVSAEKVGVGISAGPGDTPGLDVTIGYKGVGAAVVPIAIAKHCPKEHAGTCTSINYNALLVAGNNEVSAEQALVSQRYDQAARAVGDARDRDEDYRRKIEAIDSQLVELRAQVEQKTAEKNRIEGLAPEARSATEIDVLAKLPTEIDAKNTTITTLEKTRASYGGERDKLAAIITNNTKEMDRLAPQLNAASKDAKKDALSVYGTFTANPKGDRDGASLSLGKVFSTGVASQFLTQAVLKAAASPAEVQRATAECVNSATALLTQVPEAERAGIAKGLVEACAK